MKDLKVVSIGCGHIANWGHGPSLARYASEKGGITLAACCDLDGAKAEEYKKKWGFARTYTRHLEMLETEKPDAICLVVPEPFTARLATPLLETGIPLFMEKPPGVSLAEAKGLVDTAEKWKGPHAVAFNRRHMPLISAFKKAVAEAAVPLTQIRYEMVRWSRQETSFQQTAIHGLDLVTHLAASPLKQARFSKVEMGDRPKGAVHMDVSATFESGLSAQWAFSPMGGAILERLSAHGSGHSFYIRLPVWGCLDTPGVLEHYHGNKLHRTLRGDELPGGQEPFVTNGFYGEVSAFLDGVRAGTPSTDTVKSALDAMGLLDAWAQGKDRVGG